MSTYNSFFDIQNFLTTDIVQKISESIGQSVDKTKDSLKSAVPVFVTELLKKGSTPKGADLLANIVNTHNFESQIVPDEKKLNEGNDVINSILGSNLNNTVSKLSSETGLNPSSVTKMMGLVAPVVMGIISSKIKNGKMSSSEIMIFSKQQKEIITNASFESKTSEYYNLSGEDPLKVSQNILLKRNIPWKVIIFTIGFLLILMWFWWNIVQIQSPR